ncbi:AAA family ATPase [Acutalibacter sp.]|uniref:AAA family ATPase n=1 Tax=Acutalibacter sp. TaxID=1918636 RepID=UPI0034E02130
MKTDMCKGVRILNANPYTPGAGFMPAFLAGREHLLDNADMYLRSIQKRYPQQSVIYYGLRGVGKTVLLNAIEQVADNLDILNTHIEATESEKFTGRLLTALNKFAHEVSLKEAAKDLARRCSDLLKSFALTYKIEDGSIKLGINPDIELSSGVYADDLTEIFLQLGKAAQKSEDTICIFIDEAQYLKEEEIGGLIVAVHRCNQLRLPIMLFCAGLPKIKKSVGEACSYAERLFRFEEIGALSNEEATAAICEPARDFDVTFEERAVQKILEITAGYPYFIQEFCSVIWKRVDDVATIMLSDVIEAEEQFYSVLDKGFFSVRYERCSAGQKAFMTAMVKCGGGPCEISCVAKVLKKGVRTISPVRGQLISKGMIYSTGYAEIDFTVPQFDGFIRRMNPGLNLD